MIGSVTNSFAPSFVYSSPPKSYCDRIKAIPVIGYVIRAIIWLFQKIFSCFRSFETPSNETIAQIQQKSLLQEILEQHPSWKNPVEAWKGISLDDKIWLLQVYELRNLGVEIPQIVKDGDGECIPSQSAPDLLKPDTKVAITKVLNEVTEIDWREKHFKKCPRAIGLFSNLQRLDLSNNQLIAPPDVSKNLNLKQLFLSENQLTPQAKQALEMLKKERTKLQIRY